MTQSLIIQTKEASYPIYFIQSYDEIEAFFEQASCKHRKVCIVTDDNVKPLYLEELTQAIEPFFQKVVHFVMPAGEDHKHLKTVYDLYDFLMEEQFDRYSMLFALGGGVVGDLAGFAAATFLRGIDFIQCPTTLLSQVDSSIGGKTGVDFNGYKNMVGAFYQPKMVLINTSTLKTLPTRQFNSGMSEIIKHALIKDIHFLEWLETHISLVKTLDHEALTDMIYKSGCIKKEVVQEDEKELNIRALLNYGHTVGHAVEKLMDFQWSHGECVAIGMVLAGYISNKRGMLTLEELKRIEEIIRLYGLPTRISERLKADGIIKATKYDKKVRGSVLHFVLLKELGVAEIYIDVNERELEEAIVYLQQKEEH